VSVTCALCAVLGVVDVASCQSVLDRPPNLSGGWLGAPGTLQFNFVHRFGVGDAPLRKVTNSPTFLLAYQLPVPLLIGFNYATSSDVANAFPNEWEGFARYGQRGITLQAGYNQAAASFDAELTAARSFDRLRLMAVGRLLSNGYHSDTARYAVGAGATVRLNRWFALAGDATSLLDKRSGEKLAWGAGLATLALAPGYEHQHRHAAGGLARHRPRPRRVRVHDPVHAEPVLRAAGEDGGRRSGGR